LKGLKLTNITFAAGTGAFRRGTVLSGTAAFPPNYILFGSVLDTGGVRTPELAYTVAFRNRQSTSFDVVLCVLGATSFPVDITVSIMLVAV
jgi:hypothetical protein